MFRSHQHPVTRREFVQGTLLAGAAGLATGGLAAGELTNTAQGGAPATAFRTGGDWPMYRHDPALTAVSPLRGGLAEAPQVIWSLELGGPKLPSETLMVRDVTGNGSDDFLLISADTLTCRDARGNTRWKLENMLNISIQQILDFAGDGSRGILLSTYRAGKVDMYMVNGRTGKATHLWLDQNNFGGHTRVGKLLPDVNGLQVASTSSGQTPPEPQGGNVRLVSFENGLDQPNFRVNQRVSGVFYSPLILVADLDGDEQPEMIVLSHEQLWAFDARDGKQKLFAPYSTAIRTYMATVQAVRLNPTDACASLVMINPSLPGLKAVTQDGSSFARELWKVVIGGQEDQYQKRVTVVPAGTSLTYDPDGEGRWLVLTLIKNEHGDGNSFLVAFDARSGERLGESPEAQVLSADDLDGDGKLEFLLQRGTDLLICRWESNQFRTLWQGAHVLPVLHPLPTEGDPRLTSGGSPIAKGNARLWRARAGSDEFLLRFPEGVFACRLKHDELEQAAAITRHEALGNVPAAVQPSERVIWDGVTLVTLVDGKEVFRYIPPAPTTYLAPTPIVADLAGQRRILVRNAANQYLLCSAQGKLERVWAERAHEVAEVVVDPAGLGPLVCDVDDDGEVEVLVTVTDPEGRPACLILDQHGAEKRRLILLPGMTNLNRGPTGRLGPGRGRWVLLRMSGENDKRERTSLVAAFDCKTGERLWVRSHYGTYGENPVAFMAHFPSAVLDYNGDGADEWLVCSENFYGILDVKANKDLVGPVTLSGVLAGHWTAYTFPSLASLRDGDAPWVLHHSAYALALVTNLEGQPVWHYGMTRDTGSQWAQCADLDGDGQRELLHVQPDGLLRCFSLAAHARCPTCAPEAPLAASPGNPERWQLDMTRPVSRMLAADLDGDGRMELLFGCADGKLHALAERDGRPTLLWSVSLGRRVGEPILADLDGDGLPEILVTVEDGTLVCLKGS
ncbi:MAG: FG-GAP repeat domain-containing protein [Planctomycetales bacterium]